MLASLLCIQHRQVSGTLASLIPVGVFRKELLFDDIQSEVIPEIREYKKEARKLVKDKKKVKSYISVIAVADYVPEEIQQLKDMTIDGSLASKLEDQYCDTDVMLLFTVQCYLFYCEWKQKNDDEEAIWILLLF